MQVLRLVLVQDAPKLAQEEWDCSREMTELRLGFERSRLIGKAGMAYS